MQLDTASVELTQYSLNAPLDRRVVRAVAGDEFLDNRPQCRGRKQRGRDAHGLSILHNAESISFSAVPIALVEPTRRVVAAAMESTLAGSTVPLRVEIKTGKTWADWK